MLTDRYHDTDLVHLVSRGESMSLVRRVILGWDSEDTGDSVPSFIHELSLLRPSLTLQSREIFAAALFSALVEFGERLPDMYWVHVAIICTEFLTHGVAP